MGSSACGDIRATGSCQSRRCTLAVEIIGGSQWQYRSKEETEQEATAASRDRTGVWRCDG